MSHSLRALWRHTKSRVSEARRTKNSLSVVDREAQRIAAAFGVKEWTDSLCGFWDIWRRGQIEPDVWLQIEFEDNVPIVHRFVLGKYDHELGSFRDCCHAWATETTPADNPHYNAVMMRGLYRLGFDESLLAQLDSPLTAHEQLDSASPFPASSGPHNGGRKPNAV